ncbi:MAG: hypothetical protein WB762_01810, partial [Candidatus Sulfotelmatobacter sp.]
MFVVAVVGMITPGYSPGDVNILCNSFGSLKTATPDFEGMVLLAAIEGGSVQVRLIVKKVFHFEAPREKYHCDAAILWCFDNRFELGFRKFLKRI